MINNEPLRITNFFEANGAAAKQATDLAAEFYTSPGAVYVPKSIHKREYKDPVVAGLVAGLFQRLFRHVTGQDPKVTAHFALKYMESFGPLPSEELSSQYRFQWIGEAAIFQFCGYGACNYRAKYAALRLKQIFNDAVTVFVSSAPKQNHFFVSMCCADKKWVVYDPFTNPDLIFPYNGYSAAVLSSFDTVPNPSQEFKLKVTQEMVVDYEARWDRMRALLIELCEPAPKDHEALLKGPGIAELLAIQLVKNKTPRNPKIIAPIGKSALEIFNTVVARQKREAEGK